MVSRVSEVRPTLSSNRRFVDTREAQAADFPLLAAGLQPALAANSLWARLVRGLDYYSRTVFEWVTDALGAQDAICSGGRYDGLITQLGGEATPAIGFAMGVERVVELLSQLEAVPAVAESGVQGL